MDQKLVAWARTVKARRAGQGLPPLWLFTDTRRTPDIAATIRRLPVGLAGVVLRAGYAGHAPTIAALCRQRRLALVTGDAASPAALRAGVHLRAGARRTRFKPRMITSSAHDATEVARARRAGVALIFVSPVFATASHPDVAGMGVLRWSALTRRGGTFAALGGIDGRTVRRLPRWCHHVGAIGALAAPKISGVRPER